MAVDPAQMAQLAQLLSQTVGGNTQGMKQATDQLRSAEAGAGFGLMLLQLLQDGGVNELARQAGAIYFKNYIRRLWPVDAAVGGIAANDRQAIKQHLLSLMLQAPKLLQVQLSAAVEEISSTDYPDDWKTLLPEIVEHLKTSQDMQVLKGCMETAHSVFLKFRSQGRSEALLKEIKYTVTIFQETHLTVYKAVAQRILTQGASMPPDQLKAHFEMLNAILGAFYSLNIVDLPEFFEDHREEYFSGFLEILKFHHDCLTGIDAPGLLEQAKGTICESFALYTDKYQEEFSPFLLRCVTAVWTLLTGLSQEEKNDQLVAKGIHFLSSAAATSWQDSPFQDPSVLSGICEKVVFPNIILRDSDIEQFEDNPLEFIRRDIEGADQETRRRSSTDLVKAMSKLNEAKVTEILIGYVKQLMGQAAGATGPQAVRFKDACIYLCIAMAVRGQTQRDGVTAVNQSININDFLVNLVVPELRSEDVSQNPVCRASCMKFITTFRNQLPKESVMELLPYIVRHTTAPSPVVHTYAAICIEKLLTVRDRNAQGQRAFRYDPAALRPTVLQMVDPALKIVAAAAGIPQNEYLMRAVARVFTFLGQHGAEVGLTTLTPLAAILAAHADNPSNPVFNHNVFEAIASIVKVCVPSQPDRVEGALLSTFGLILEKNVTDFLPYTFQILGLLLDATPSVKPLYQELFGRLLTVELWRANANVPGLIRLLRAYFSKSSVFGELLKANMQSILERVQFVISNNRTESSGFDLINSMYLHLPFEFYQQHLKTLVTVLLTRLQQKKQGKFQKDFTTSCSVLVHKTPAGVFPQLMGEIQAGLLVNILTSMWLPSMKMPRSVDERKVCAVALAKLMSHAEISQNQQVFGQCCLALISLLGLLPSTQLSVEEESDDDAPPDLGAGLDYEVSFNKLKNTDLPGSSSSLAPDVPDLHAGVKALLAPAAASVAQLATQSGDLQPLAQFLR